ncbi:MAG: hypothetical protein ACYSUB_01680 [Planctomycetota bacterium]|jgi:hypothetical protein
MPKGKARYQPSIGKKPFNVNRTRHNQLQERREFILRDIKRKMKEKGTIADRVPYVWEWRYGDKFGTVNHFTRSDARGEIKRMLGVSKKKRLPNDVQIRRVEFNEPS